MELAWRKIYISKRIIEEVNVCTCSTNRGTTVQRLIPDADCDKVLCIVYPSIQSIGAF